jgi:tRNA (cmo5U34)-methyltransferase
MGDNATAHSAEDYEGEVARTIPFHAEILRVAVDVALAAFPSPSRWLDTGCGPGALVAHARTRAPDAAFFLADPSAAMLALARERHGELPPERFLHAPSEALPALAPFDVVTAVQCHHYGDMEARRRSVARCAELLSPRGVLVAFENVRAETDAGQRIQRARWVEFQRGKGRSEATIEAQLAREGTKFFPVRVSEHVALFGELGFDVVEIVWRAYGQAGFLATRSPA